MNLNNEKVAEFVGGDMEIQNKNEGYLYRGPIKSATIENNMLLIKFAWLARGEGYPPSPINWKKEDKFASDGYIRNLKFYGVSEIGNDRLSLCSFISGELLILFPLNGSKLDPAKVEGLKLS